MPIYTNTPAAPCSDYTYIPDEGGNTGSSFGNLSDAQIAQVQAAYASGALSQQGFDDIAGGYVSANEVSAYLANDPGDPQAPGQAGGSGGGSGSGISTPAGRVGGGNTGSGLPQISVPRPSPTVANPLSTASLANPLSFLSAASLLPGIPNWLIIGSVILVATTAGGSSGGKKK
jgi:hypothetical protein